MRPFDYRRAASLEEASARLDPGARIIADLMCASCEMRGSDSDALISLGMRLGCVAPLEDSGARLYGSWQRSPAFVTRGALVAERWRIMIAGLASAREPPRRTVPSSG